MKTPVAVLVLAAAAAGCGESLPDKWTLKDTGIEVEIRRDPYAVIVRDATGRELLASRTPGAGGTGRGAVATAAGSVSWNSVVTPGWFEPAPDLDAWADRWKVSAVEQGAGELTVNLVPADGAPGAAPVRVVHKVRPSALRVEASAQGANPRAFGATFNAPSDEHYLGFGERYGHTDQRGRVVYSFAEEGGFGGGEGKLAGPSNPFPNGENMTYYPVPFFVSTRGYGFWLDSTWWNQFELATPDAPDAWRVWHIGPKLAYEVFVPTPGDARPWPHQIIDSFTARVGRAMLPPAWSFGPRRRVSMDYQVDGVPEIQRMRELDLAITSIDDSVHFLPTASEVGRENDLKMWVASARKQGYRVNAYFNSLFSNEMMNPLKPQIDDAIAKNYFLRDASGKLSEVFLISGRLVTVFSVDFTSQAATDWYTKFFDRALSLGYSGWMYDFGEYVQPDVVASNGMTGEELHNLYPVLYDKAAFDALEAGPHKGDWFYFSRSGYTGSWRYSPMVWGGDPTASFDDALGLPSVVRGGVNIGLSGAPHWGSDIGGFKCFPDDWTAADGELWARWIEVGAFGSNMMDQNACVQPKTPGKKASIWTAPDAMAAWKTYARLHTRLFPYLYTLAHEATRTGAPTMRHLFFEHPDRVDFAGVDDVYYFGPAILVAPVVKRGAREKTIDLPAGLFVDWRDGTLLTGGQKVTRPAPLREIPVFLRDGYLVPMLDPSIDTLAEEDSTDIVSPKDVAGVYDVAGLISTKTGRASFTLYDGAKLTAEWKGGFANPTGLRAAKDESDFMSCSDGCYLVESLAGNLRRVRINDKKAGTVAAGGLTLTATTARVTRWDLYLAE